MNGALRCQHCDDVIGVYEPMIVLTAGGPRSTSRAAEPRIEGLLAECYHDASECYHDACYRQVHAEESRGPSTST
ncbi:MAG: hypothetical protein ABSG95_00290 [Solirubrobacteraceae bacterium]|jgi:hypothetical protein